MLVNWRGFNFNLINFMKVVFMAERPEEIQFSMTLTMSLNEWLELDGQLTEKWPSSRLAQIISSMRSQAEHRFYSKSAGE